MDPKAIAADPQGYARWQQQASAAGYNYGPQGQNQGGGWSPQTPGVRSTTINPNADLRSQQITSGYDPRLATAQRQSDSAAGKVAGFSGYTPFQAVDPNDAYTARASDYTGKAEAALGSGYVAPTDTSRAQAYLDRAGGSLPTASMGGVSYGGDTGQIRSRLAESLNALQGPDRSKLALDQFKLLQEQNAPARALAQRQVGQKAAALGRIGAGMTTNDLTGLEQRYAREDDQAQRALAGDAAAQTLNDRLGIANAIQGGFGTLAGEDRAAAGLSQNAAQFNAGQAGQNFDRLRGLSDDQLRLSAVARGEGEADRAYGLQRAGALTGLGDTEFSRGTSLRNEARGDRSDRLAHETADLTAKRGVLGDLSSREDQLYGYGRDARDELRGERGYQTDRADKAQEDRIRQTLLEDQLLGSSTDRAGTLSDRLYRYGYGNDPTNTIGAAGQNEQANADEAFGGVGSLLEQYLLAHPGGTKVDPNTVFGSYRPNVKNTTRTTTAQTIRPGPTTLPRYGG